MPGAAMPASLGRYRLIERIAVGGMGEVHRGIDVGWGGVERPVAIKLIAPEFARHADFVQTFADEARLSYRLNHTNLVHVRDIGQWQDTWFIAMEWVDGVDLATLLKRSGDKQPLPPRFAVLIAIEAARGLDYAHRLREPSGQTLALVHRDVSPTNLLLSYEGEVKVTDFGIARWKMRQAVSLPGAVKGKLGYMAPEQARGEEVDLRADVFSLGVVLYESLTGRNPFTDAGVRDADLLARGRAGHYAPPSDHLSVPIGLEAIVLRAMAPRREDRYASCAQLREDLEGFARREAWAMSTSHLGSFVRSVIDATHVASDPALADTAASPEVKRRTPTPTTPGPRPFDQALGAQLAALAGLAPPGDGEGEGELAGPPLTDAEPAEATTTRGKALPPRTVALHRTIDPNVAPEPVVAPEAAAQAPDGPSTADLTELVRKPRPIGAILLGTGLLALAALGLLAVKMLQSPEPLPSPPPPEANVAPARPPAPEPPKPVAPTKTPAPEAGKGTRHAHTQSASPQPAHLTITTDVDAELWVDGKLVGETPVKDLAVWPGRHLVRAIGHRGGLRLVPKEETILVRDGESVTHPMELE
jgi:serine/threonine protein kinase